MTAAAAPDPDANWRLKRRPGNTPEPYAQTTTGFYGTRLLGSVAEATIGCMVWAHTEGDPHQVRLDHHGQPRGGIILDTHTGVDIAWLEQTGEIVERKHFWCYNPYTDLAHAYTTLTEAQIVAEGCETPSPALIARHVRRIAADLANRKGPLTVDQTRLYTALHRLAATVTGPQP